MYLFPILVGLILLELIAELVFIVPLALHGLAVERRLRFRRGPLRAIIALTIVELVFVLAWGLFLRSHFA